MANKNIRGITIEIGGDTTKLGKALENSEKKSRSLQTELREIEKALKLDPSNVELLAQKQTVLTQNVAETTDKLDTLKEAEKQVIAQFERGEVAEEQVRALKREISLTENTLGSMKTELDQTTKAMKDLADGTQKVDKNTDEYKQSVADATKELEDFKSKASDTFEVLAKGVGALGAGATATAGYALKITTEFDKAYNTLQTQTGATVEEMDKLDESMQNIYKNMLGESMDDVAQSMAIVKTQTKLTDKELEKVTSSALLIRDTFGFEVNESIRAVNSMVNQFGISADEAYNLIAQGAQNGLNQNGDLMDIINEYSVQFKNAGYDAEDMFNMLANGADAGTWSVDKLGDAFKEYNIRMSDGSALEYLEKLGLNTDEVTAKYAEGGESAQEATNMIIEALKGVENEQDRYMIGQGIMGTMWEDLGEDAIFSLMNTQGEISKTSDALENINEIKYDDLGSALSGLKRTLETDVIDPLGDELKPVVEDVISYVQTNAPQIKEVVGNILTAVGEFIKVVVDNGDTIIAVIGGIATGLLAWNVVSMITGVVKAIQAFKLANEGATIAQWALNTAMNANPIGIIITLIAGLVAGFVILWNTSEDFRNFFINLWETIKNAVSTAITAIVGFFTGLWDSIVSIFSGVATWFYDNVISPITNFFSNLWTGISQGVMDLWNGVISWAVGIATWIYDNIIAPIANFFTGLWNGIVEAYHTVIDPWIEIFIRIATIIYDNVIVPVTEFFRNLWTTVVGFFTNLWNDIVTGITNWWNNVVAIVSGVATWWYENVVAPIFNFFSDLWNGIVEGVTGWWNSVVAVVSGVATWWNDNVIAPIRDLFVGLWDKALSGAKKAWDGIKSVFSSLANFFGNIFKTAWEKVKKVFSVGGKIFDGIKDGIVSAFKTVVNAIIKGINKVVALPFKGINGVLDTISNVSIVGIKPFSWLTWRAPIPQIPELYRGGVLKKGQTGYLEGDGTEAVVPLERETGWINRIAQKMNDLQDTNQGASNVGLASKMDEIIQTMKALKSTIVLDTGTLVGETINQIDEQLGNNYSMRERRI